MCDTRLIQMYAIERETLVTCQSRLQHTATRCNTLQRIAKHCNTLRHTATHCITLQHNWDSMRWSKRPLLTCQSRSQHTATHCNTLQHTATHCNTLQHIWFDATARRLHARANHNCKTLPHTATHCNTLQHTATHCNTSDSMRRSKRPSPSRQSRSSLSPEARARDPDGLQARWQVSFVCLYRAPLSVCMALLSVYKALLSVYRALLSVYRALLSVCNALWVCKGLSLKALSMHWSKYQRIWCVGGSFQCAYCSFECTLYSLSVYRAL